MKLPNTAPQQKERAMDLDQLMGRYFRLKQELSIAYRAQPWQSARIDRIADELAATERDIASLHPRDEPHGQSALGFAR
jgi:hypothetical protein